MKNVPLRVKLVAAMCVLVTAALAVTGIVATKSLHSYLLDRVDSQLHDAASGPMRFGPGSGPDDGRGGQTPDGDDFLGAYYIQHINADGSLGSLVSHQYSAGSDAAPKLPGLTLTQVQAQQRQPFTVPPKTGGHSWRAVASPDPRDGGSVVFALSLGDVDSTVHRLEL